jgi:hypothetical protein
LFSYRSHVVAPPPAADAVLGVGITNDPCDLPFFLRRGCEEALKGSNPFTIFTGLKPLLSFAKALRAL